MILGYQIIRDVSILIYERVKKDSVFIKEALK